MLEVIIKDIKETMKKYCTILQMPEPELKIKKGPTIGGLYKNNVVYLFQPVIDKWNEERSKCEFVLVHELIHAKYRESSWIEGLASLFLPSVAVKKAYSELRANTLAFELTGMNEADLTRYFTEDYATDTQSFITYSGGYLLGNENIEFIRLHPIWTNRTVQDATAYFKSYNWWYKLVSQQRYEKLQNLYLRDL